MSKNPLHPPEDLDHDELFKRDRAAAIAVAIWENETFVHLDWYRRAAMNYPGWVIKIVYDDPEHEDGKAKSKFVTFDEFRIAADKIISGEVEVNKNTRQLIEDACLRNEMGQWDINDMDCVAQVALFGEVVYG